MILTKYKGKNSFAAWTTHHRKLGDGSPMRTVTPWVETGCGARARSSLRGRRGSRARSSSARGRSPRSPRAPAPGWRLGPSPRSSRRRNIESGASGGSPQPPPRNSAGGDWGAPAALPNLHREIRPVEIGERHPVKYDWMNFIASKMKQ